MTTPQQSEANYDRPKYLEAVFKFRGKLLEADYSEAYYRGKLLFRGSLHASVEIEANSRGKFSIRGRLFLRMKWGHFLFGGLIWMSWTLILRLRQHS
jgi:hypothetical protein